MAAGRQPQLEDVPKSSLVDGSGQSYGQFRTSLRPNWPVVAFDFALGFVMLAVVAVLIVAASQAAAGLRVLWIAIGAVLIGFWMAYIQLFLHEAAHFNLWPDRRVNDLLANALIGVWVATDVREYRQIHWDHHRFLGQPTDTERSYFSTLGWRFLLESLFLVNALRVIWFRRGKVAQKSRAPLPFNSPGSRMIVAAAFAHALVISLCIWQQQLELAAAWLIGNLMVYPLFGALRQLLEHRDAGASAAVDYSIHPHGKTTRSFKAGPVGSFFGGAGFRWHDIHHFDPELSYTNLATVDSFLRGCSSAGSARGAKKSYERVALELWQR